MASKQGFSADKHTEVGAYLRQVRNELVSLSVDVANAYPTTAKQGKRARRNLAKALEAIDELRSDLEYFYAKENADDWSTKTYYGGE